MRLEWDESKRRKNLRNHHIDFRDLSALFRGIHLRRPDLRFDYGEDRWIATGFVGAAVVLVVYTEKAGGTIRIISARKANRYEREQFDIEISDRLGVSERSER